ncbi:Uncharacterised protein [Candidatus Anstonella stagnisolia]|nr:Uncharacterised protein [Candidatus Anstonella stagnisolia]
MGLYLASLDHRPDWSHLSDRVARYVDWCIQYKLIIQIARSGGVMSVVVDYVNGAMGKDDMYNAVKKIAQEERPRGSGMTEVVMPHVKLLEMGYKASVVKARLVKLGEENFGRLAQLAMGFAKLGGEYLHEAQKQFKYGDMLKRVEEAALGAEFFFAKMFGERTGARAPKTEFSLHAPALERAVAQSSEFAAQAAVENGARAHVQAKAGFAGAYSKEAGARAPAHAVGGIGAQAAGTSNANGQGAAVLKVASQGAVFTSNEASQIARLGGASAVGMQVAVAKNAPARNYAAQNHPAQNHPKVEAGGKGSAPAAKETGAVQQAGGNEQGALQKGRAGGKKGGDAPNAADSKGRDDGHYAKQEIDAKNAHAKDTGKAEGTAKQHAQEDNLRHKIALGARAKATKKISYSTRVHMRKQLASSMEPPPNGNSGMEKNAPDSFEFEQEQLQ